ncbi:MAG: hypothetical protein FJ220_01105, partial [Kiritimatiellaceae bacterium]|nr:hypothetical protein [Kiritimatiellaceae bacterium]
YFPESGKHLAIEIDPVRSSVRECGDLKIPPVKSAQASSLSSAPVAVAAAGEVVPTGSTVVDVMIVYTPAALAMEGNTANMNANIAVAMQKANAAHSNSDTRIYLHLVRSEQVSYVESGDDGLDLDRLTWTSDGHMDNVHVLRDTYGADLVCLFSDTADVGGLGWLLTDESGEPEYAFCLAYIGQTDTGYTVVHEWGHNMGCSHSKSQAIEPWDSTDFRSYSAGWQWADAHGSFSGYCTVMTYQDWNNDGRREYERVPHFSNPNKSYNGRATGHVTDGDNARTMREMKAVYASYRATMVPPPPFETDVVTTYPYIESFETGYGAWRGGTNIGAYWKRHAGATPQTASGPSAAAEGSNYVYSSSFTVGASTNLTAWFDFSSLTEPIFSWSYHMYGAQIGTLYLEISTDGDSWETLWWATGNLGDAWYRASVNLGGYGGQELVHVRFRHVVTAAGQKTEAAVDYITVEQKPLDIDLDGLPNEWELYYYGDETYADPAADDDGDGFSNLSEYIGGTDPWDPSSFFSVTALERADSAAGFVVHWNAVSGRVYSVNSSSNLLDGFQPLEENILYPQSSYTDAVQRAGQYYKVGVQLEP